MSDTNAPEPTMEEILASIRRIISEDDAPAATPEQTAPAAVHAAPAEPQPSSQPVVSAPEPDADDDVLELTEPLDSIQGRAEPAHQASPHDVLGDLDFSSSPPSPPEPSPAPRSPMPSMSMPIASNDGQLVSGSTAQAAASAFSQLTGSTSLPAPGRTLEDMVREMLRPMLRDWLDANLPAIVESTVRAEVERIARSRVY